MTTSARTGSAWGHIAAISSGPSEGGMKMRIAPRHATKFVLYCSCEGPSMCSSSLRNARKTVATKGRQSTRRTGSMNSAPTGCFTYPNRGRNHARDSRSAASCARPRAYVFSNLYSNFWRIFGKLWEAHSRLYRNESLQVKTRWKAVDEIYKIYKLLHRSAFKNSTKFRQTFSHFCTDLQIYSQIFHWMFVTVVQNSPILMIFSRKFQCQQFLRKRSKSPRFSIFLRFRTKKCCIFRKWFLNSFKK